MKMYYFISHFCVVVCVCVCLSLCHFETPMDIEYVDIVTSDFLSSIKVANIVFSVLNNIFPL